jgi:hypothetical protein
VRIGAPVRFLLRYVGKAWARLPLSPGRNRQLGRERVQGGGELGLLLDVGNPAEGAKKDFPGELFCLFRATRHTQTERVDTPFVQPVEREECLLVAALSARNESELKSKLSAPRKSQKAALCSSWQFLLSTSIRSLLSKTNKPCCVGRKQPHG